MGIVSGTESESRDAAAASEGTREPDGSHPESAPSTDDSVIQLSAPGAGLQAVWAKPATKIGTALLAVIAITVYALMLSNVSFKHQANTPSKPTFGTATNQPGNQPGAGGNTMTETGSDAPFTKLTDTSGQYTLAYPSTWTDVTDQASTPEAGAGHVIQIAEKNAFSIRTFPLASPVASKDLDDLRAVTDSILSTPDAKLQVLDVRKVEVGDLPAVYYLYYFLDGKQRGIHAHYFIFNGTQMHSVVFQVVPATDFANYATTFDHVIASFKPLNH